MGENRNLGRGRDGKVPFHDAQDDEAQDWDGAASTVGNVQKTDNVGIARPALILDSHNIHTADM